MRPIERLRHHVSGAIERGEKQPIVEQAKSAGQLAYERDVAMRPLYNVKAGTPRSSWENLSPIAKQSWELNPTDRADDWRRLARGPSEDR